MAPLLPKYPFISKFLSNLSGYTDTFLFDRLCNPNYGFWLHLEHFLININRYRNHESIIERLSFIVPLKSSITEAWEKWRKFRSAQSEVTTIFIIEKYFSGQVAEIVPINQKPTPDFKVVLNDCGYFLEVKAQSGQQHGSRHPREKGLNLFSPKDEVDLKSWLFKERISSRNGKPMKPKAIEADGKGADILVAMTDYFNTVDNVKEQTSFICPGSIFLDDITIQMVKPLTAHFFRSIYPVKKELKTLKEIWLFDESHLEVFVVLSGELILLEHLKKTR